MITDRAAVFLNSLGHGKSIVEIEKEEDDEEEADEEVKK